MELELSTGKVLHEVSPTLYGLFLEDINFACDGGLNANMVENYSFDGSYMNKGYNQMLSLLKFRPKVKADRLRYWECTGGTMQSCEDDGISKKNPWYARITSDGDCTIRNRGYNGHQVMDKKCAMSIAKGHDYNFSGYFRTQNPGNKIEIFLCREDGTRLTSSLIWSIQSKWKYETGILHAEETGYGMLVINYSGTGSFDMDCINCSDVDVWGKDDPKWTGGHFRKDLVETLMELKPSFLRFPGGCIVEGLYPGNEYQWKNTVGPLVDRIPAVNLWATNIKEKGYCQSYLIGFYEYFLLCEDLKMEPLPMVWAGLNCQMRSKASVRTDSAEFDEVVQNALDLIEFANGDPEKSKWAKIRAESGHPAPFGMKMIGIGNENYGSDYHQKFTKIKKAISKRYPDILCIISSGGFPEGKAFDESWEFAKKHFPDVLLDEHFYKGNDWLYSMVHRYDNYPRNTTKVFLGEYAGNDIMKPKDLPNTFGSALAEAAFLTGIERNSDVVKMSCYAPLLCLVQGNQWKHNMIEFNPRSVMKTANYFVQRMFMRNIGTEFLDIIGNMPEKVYASATQNEKNLFFKLVNASEETIKFSFLLPQNVTACAKAEILQQDSLDTANHLSFNGTAEYNVLPVECTETAKDGRITISIKKYSIIVLTMEREYTYENK